ncbi:MAG: tetratricopeptide repeat protein [Bacteroidota bacterium]
MAVSVLLLLSQITLMGQKTADFQSPDQLYQSAYELYQKQKYGAAQTEFEQVIKQIDAPGSLMKINAEYYAALCALELFNEDAEQKLESFIRKYPENSKVRTAHFQLGKYQYRKERHHQAIRSFLLVDVYDLNPEEQHEYYFKLGYSSFMTDDMEEAKGNFYKIINTENKYQDPANYYYGHIAYENGNYETALESFNTLMDNDIFKPILPYYITQIYYKQEKYGKLLEIAPGLYKNATSKRKAEIARLIGDAYYKTQRYAEAVPFLEEYHKLSNRTTTRDDHYQLAYAYYQTKEYKKAIPEFDQVARINDSIAQNAYYHMADCYLQTDQKKFAFNAFSSAYKQDYDAKITRDALFNYAKLAYELSYDPYNQAIDAFQRFIQNYPNSSRVDEANSFLVKLFLSTKNYKDALEALDRIEQKSTNLKIAYQQVAYYHGVEMFNNKNYDQAMELFDKSMRYDYNKELTALSFYWKGEAQYRKGDFEKSIEVYKQFQITAGAFRLPQYNESNYNIAYGYFKLNQYNNALTYFRKFLDNEDTPTNSKMINDAMIRTADCYHTQKRMDEAIETYERVISKNISDVDYALYQKALAEGVSGDYQAKTASLKQLINNYPNSPYADDASYEVANTYLILDNNQQALRYFNHLINNYPNSTKMVQAKQKKALVYYNTNNYELALNTFKSIREEYPGTQESKEALVSIRNIYTNINKPEEFFSYAKENAINLSSDNQDSTLYQTAEKIYMDGDCEKATAAFNRYLNQFPKGIFALKAHYYWADCLYRQGDKKQASKHYILIADTSMNEFTERAVINLASYYYESGQYQDALNYYQQLLKISNSKKYVLEARKWSMRCYWKLKEHQNAIITARELIKTDKVSDEWVNEAYMTIGKSSLKLDSISTAKKAFEYLSENLQNEMAVEAKYLIAEIEYQNDNFKESEDILFEIINQVPSYDYWIARSFILIADIYYQRGNIAQTRATLQSIIDNYKPDPESNRPNLVEIAKEKLETINAMEEAKKQKDTEEDDIELDYSGEEAPRLFNEEENDSSGESDENNNPENN